ERVVRLKKELKSLALRRNTLRSKRKEQSLPTVVFVGYTSAGKSTLFNALTVSHQAISRGLFTTLDPLSRTVFLPNHQKIVVSDTVGFIRQLPHHLIEAFKATLEEVVEADLLVHVLDVSTPKTKDFYYAVQKVLDQLGAGEKNTVLALNKIDLLPSPNQLERFLRDYPDGIGISALKRINLDGLLNKIEEKLKGYVQDVTLTLPLEKMDVVDFIYRQGRVKDISYDGPWIHLTASLPVIAACKLKAYIR
ncbi:MAG: GTPase, partial [Candidatus Omnitrophota bacterium]